MRVFKLSMLGFQYFNLHKKRYLFLIIALSFGFGVITTLTSIKEGMEQNLYFTAQSHYAGDIIIQGENKSLKTILTIPDPQKIIREIEDSDIAVDRIVLRTQLGKGTIFYNGTAVNQKYILGVDWENELDYFNSIEYKAIAENPYVSKSIMISSPVAEEMNVQLGDLITIEVQSKFGPMNTGNFVVSGIIDDSSIFGYYKAYVSRKELNSMIQYDDDQCSTLGLYLTNIGSLNATSSEVHQILASILNMAPQVYNRDDLLREKRKSWKGIKFFILTLPIYLSEVSQLLLAIELVAYFLYIMMLLIIIVSVLVTYRLILHEREKEIGTMRAIAFSQGEVISLLLLESLILFVISIIVGFIVSRIVIWGVSFIPMDFMPSIEIFMKNGKITAVYTLRTTLINIGIVLISLLPAVLWPVYNASKQPLAVVLTGGNK